MSIEVAFVISMVVLLVLALKVKLNAFLNLLLTSLVMGLLAGMNPGDVLDAILGGFSSTIKSIGVVIIFGVMLGNYLESSKSTNTIASRIIGLVGQNHAGLAMAISGFIISIPVFCDAAFVILMPIVKAIAKKTKIQMAVLASALCAGLWATHVYVPPTPGPLAAAGLLGIDLGRAIIYGCFASIFMTAGGWLFAELYLKRKSSDFFTFSDGHGMDSDLEDTSFDMTQAPGAFISFLPLFLPIILILVNTTCAMIFPEGSPVLTVTGFIGDSNIALALGCLAAILLFMKKIGVKSVMSIMDQSMKDAGPIVFITAAGGSLGQILKVSGAGASMAEVVANTGIPFILIPFAIAGILKIVQGSGTVAVVTAATLSAPIGAQLGLDPILIFMASGAGARSCCHVNDSMFWIFSNYTGYDIKTTLKTMSLTSIFCAAGGLLATFIAGIWL